MENLPPTATAFFNRPLEHRLRSYVPTFLRSYAMSNAYLLFRVHIVVDPFMQASATVELKQSG